MRFNISLKLSLISLNIRNTTQYCIYENNICICFPIYATLSFNDDGIVILAMHMHHKLHSLQTICILGFAKFARTLAVFMSTKIFSMNCCEISVEHLDFKELILRKAFVSMFKSNQVSLIVISKERL